VFVISKEAISMIRSNLLR